MLHVATRISNLRYDLVETAKRSWKDAGRPGVEEYWLDSLSYYRDTIINIMRSLGFYPYPENWYDSEDNFRFTTVQVDNTLFSISIPSRWSAGTPLPIFAEDCLQPEFFYYVIKDYYVQTFSFADEVNNIDIIAADYIDYILLVLLEDYLQKIEPSVYDIDKNGCYAFLLFWSDTGEMLSPFEAEEWWCDHSLKEIESMYADILNPAYTSYGDWKVEELPESENS